MADASPTHGTAPAEQGFDLETLTQTALKQVNDKADAIRDELRDSAYFRNLAISSLAHSQTTAEAVLAHRTGNPDHDNKFNEHLERAGRTAAAVIASDPSKSEIDHTINGNMNSSNSARELVTWIAKGNRFSVVKGFKKSQEDDAPKPSSRSMFRF